MADVIDPHAAVDYLLKHAKQFAQARANRVYLEEFRKSKKAMLMNASDAKTEAGKEREAYADPAYIEVLEGLRSAVETEEALRWHLIAAQARVEIWRSQEASNRAVDRGTR